MNQKTLLKLAGCFRNAEEGIEYHPKYGAKCPWCGDKLRVQDSKPWGRKTRIRYQKCLNPKCPLSCMDKTVKSIQSL